MEELLTNAFSTGDIKIVLAALVVYAIIYIQRKQTSEKRDEDTDSLTTRITLLEHDNQMLHEQVTQIGSKLDKILETLSDIKVELAKKEDR